MSERKQQLAGVIFLAAAALGALAPMLHLEHGTLALIHLVMPLVFAFCGAMLFTGRSSRSLCFWLGAAMIGWFYLSRLLLGEPLLDESYTRLCGMCLAYLMALPFADCMRDVRKRGLTVVAAGYAAVMGILGWIGVYACFTGRVVTIPYLDTHISLSTNISGTRLWINTHPNTSASMLLIAFMLGAWLIARSRGRVVHGVLLAAMLGMYIAIALTVSRTVMIQLSCFAGGLAALGVLRIPLKARWKRWAIAIPVAVVCVVLVFFSFYLTLDGFNAMHALAEKADVVAQRSLTKDLYTLTGRTYIYQNALRLLRTQPRVLLLGVLDAEVGQVFINELHDVHAHNSWLQTAINYGLPALLIAVALLIVALKSGLYLIFHDKARLEEQMLAGMLLVLLLGSITEPYLFTDNTTICNFLFMLILGYTAQAKRRLQG